MKKYRRQILTVLPVALLFVLGTLSFALFSAKSPWTASAINYSWKFIFFAAVGIGLAVLVGLPVFKPAPDKKVLWGSVLIGGTFLTAVALNLAQTQALTENGFIGEIMNRAARNVDGGRSALVLIFAGILLLADGLNHDKKRSYPVLCAAGLFGALTLIAVNTFAGGFAAVILIAFLLCAQRKQFTGSKTVKIVCNAVVLILPVLFFLLMNEFFLDIALYIYGEHRAVQLPVAPVSVGRLSVGNAVGQMLGSFGWIGLIAAVLLSAVIIAQLFRAADRSGTISNTLIWKLSAAYFGINIMLRLFFSVVLLPMSGGSRFSFVQFGPALTVDYFLIGLYLTQKLKPSEEKIYGGIQVNEKKKAQGNKSKCVLFPIAGVLIILALAANVFIAPVSAEGGQVKTDTPETVAAANYLNPPVPERKRQIRFNTPEIFDMTGGSASDLNALAERTNLTSVLFTESEISDINALSGLPKLDWLYLSENNISDISPLSGMARLEHLYLSYNAFTDISPLSELTNLKSLFLSGNDIEDLSPLNYLTKLNTLALDGCGTSGIEVLSGLKNLESLCIPNNGISNINALSNLTSLKTLNISNNNVNDVSALYGLSNLEELELTGNPLTNEQLDALRVELPDCKIIFENNLMDGELE